MKKIIKNSKRGIAAILTLCMLLGITATCVNAATISEETSVSAESTVVISEGTTPETEENIVVLEKTKVATKENTIATEKTAQELMPMMASGCENDYNHIFGNPEHNLDGFVGYYGGNQAAAYAAVSVAAQAYVTSHQITGIINAFNQITVNVSGFNITVRGNVINGRLNIGTFFII